MLKATKNNEITLLNASQEEDSNTVTTLLNKEDQSYDAPSSNTLQAWKNKTTASSDSNQDSSPVERAEQQINYDNPIVYSTGIGNKQRGFLAGAGAYTPQVFLPQEVPEIDVVGVHEVGDCIGILAWDPQSKTTLVYHMNEVDKLRLSFGLLKFVIAANLAPSYHKEFSLLLEALCNNTQTPEYALYELKKHNLLKSIQFTLVTRMPRSLEGLCAVLMRAGINNNNLFIDTKQSKLIMSRETGVVCADFNAEKTSVSADYFDTPAEKSQKQEKLRLQAEETRQKNDFLAATPAEKFQRLVDQQVIGVVNNRLIFSMCDRKLEILEPFKEQIFIDLLIRSKELNINSIQLLLYPPSGPLKYQSIPTLFIQNLTIHGNHIKSMAINITSQAPSNSKTDYLSQFAISAAHALRENGRFLEKFEVKANTRGREAFSNALVHLKQVGILQEFSVLPIVGAPSLEPPSSRFVYKR